MLLSDTMRFSSLTNALHDRRATQEGTKTSPLGAFCQTSCRFRCARISAALVLFCFCTMIVDTGLAQGGKAAPLRLLGKFAVDVAYRVATKKVVEGIETRIYPENEPERTEPRVSGYTFTLMWQSHHGTYVGHLRMQGVRGTFRVRTPDSAIIDQDITASYYKGAVLLVGSNPRYATSGGTVNDYAPDGFRLVPLSTGEWTIVDTIDAQGVYSPVQVVQSGTF
jgi:hypothetical protein